MRVALAAVMVGIIGCSKEPPSTTNRSVWWVPVVAWNDTSLDNKICHLLADR
jgi:hypothetical protein